MTTTLQAPHTLDIDLAQRADRKLRHFGSDLNNVLSIIMSVRGAPDFISTVKPPMPLAFDDPRLDKALADVKVRRLKSGGYVAETKAADGMDADGNTRAEAVANLRDELRYLISDPVDIGYVAYGRRFTAKARPARGGGYWATVPALGGSATQGGTMDELKYMLIDMTKLLIEER